MVPFIGVTIVLVNTLVVWVIWRYVRHNRLPGLRMAMLALCAALFTYLGWLILMVFANIWSILPPIMGLLAGELIYWTWRTSKAKTVRVQP